MGIRQDIVEAAERYLGRPYAGIYSGVGPDSFTCSGLTWRAYHDAGIDIPVCQGIHSYYTDSYNGWDTQAGWTLVNGHAVYEEDELGVGDLVFYSPVGDPERTGHVAIYVGDGEVIHANGAPVAITPLDDGGWFVFGGWPLAATPEELDETIEWLRESPMDVIVEVEGKGVSFWLCGDHVHDLTHPHDIDILDTMWGACHDGERMPRARISADWYGRLCQCCKAGFPSSLKAYEDAFKPRS